MVSFFLLISFVLHGATIIALVFVYNRIQHLKSNQLQEMTEMFETYLNEIKDENKQLQEQLNATSNEVHSSSKGKINSVYDEFLPIGETLNDKDSNDEVVLSDTKVNMETSFEASVLQLYQQGISEDDIARRLNSGKTEVALVINLYGKKQHKS